MFVAVWLGDLSTIQKEDGVLAGGGINVPVKIKMEAARSSIRELKDELLKVCIRARIK